LTLQDKQSALSKDARLHIGLTLRNLLDDEDGRAVLEEHLHAVLAHPVISIRSTRLWHLQGFHEVF
jgi:hypothetical protein